MRLEHKRNVIEIGKFENMDLFTSINPMETDSCQEACSRKQTKMAPSYHSYPVSTQVSSCHETRDQKNRAI